MTLVVRNPAPGSRELQYVAGALERGALVVVPTDTVYGIAALATSEEAVASLYALKGRDAAQPTAVAFATVEQARETLTGLSPRASWALAALLPGPWTLVVDNPEGHLPWLTGGAPGPIGIRVPAGALNLPPIAATSANYAGEPTITAVTELPQALLDDLACVVDAGPLDSTVASTVLDLVAWERGDGEVTALRDEAGRFGQALAVLAGAP